MLIHGESPSLRYNRRQVLLDLRWSLTQKSILQTTEGRRSIPCRMTVEMLRYTCTRLPSLIASISAFLSAAR